MALKAPLVDIDNEFSGRELARSSLEIDVTRYESYGNATCVRFRRPTQAYEIFCKALKHVPIYEAHIFMLSVRASNTRTSWSTREKQAK